MNYLFVLFFSLLLFACANNKQVYWCGDHACVNKKEKNAYFKKNMIVEIRDLNNRSKKNKSEFEKIKDQAGLDLEKDINNKKQLIKQTRVEKKRRVKEVKELAKQSRLEEKRRIKEEKKLAKQARMLEKRRIKEEKKLAEQVRLEEKKIFKQKKKLSKKKASKTGNASIEKEILMDKNDIIVNVFTDEFSEIKEKITKKNMFKPFPDINDLPN